MATSSYSPYLTAGQHRHTLPTREELSPLAWFSGQLHLQLLVSLARTTQAMSTNTVISIRHHCGLVKLVPRVGLSAYLYKHGKHTWRPTPTNLGRADTGHLLQFTTVVAPLFEILLLRSRNRTCEMTRTLLRITVELPIDTSSYDKPRNNSPSVTIIAGGRLLPPDEYPAKSDKGGIC